MYYLNNSTINVNTIIITLKTENNYRLIIYKYNNNNYKVITQEDIILLKIKGSKSLAHELNINDK